MQRRIVIPGGSGQVGRTLARYFHGRGDDVTVLSRNPSAEPWRVLPWNGRDLGPWAQSFDGCYAVINLAGRSVDCRYTAPHRREIISSRVDSTRAVGRAIEQSAHPPAVWMNSSTATIYRHALDRSMDETTGEVGGKELGVPPRWKFSIEVATAWENEFFSAATPHTRKIALRSAMIMSPDRGGVFDKLWRLARVGLGGPIGAGTQYLSWIHHADFINALEFLMMHDELAGCINVSAPNPLPNRDFMDALRQAVGTPIGLPSYNWMLAVGTFFLRTETELVLKSRRVVPKRLLDAGFEFHFPDWPAAARDLIRCRTLEKSTSPTAPTTNSTL